jgi:hypothetical protein
MFGGYWHEQPCGLAGSQMTEGQLAELYSPATPFQLR